MIRLLLAALALWGAAATGVRAQLPPIGVWDEISCEDVLSTWPSGTDFPPGLSTAECYTDGGNGLYVWVTDWVVEPARSLFKYLSRPQACVVCEILYGIMDFLKPLGNAAFTLLVDPVLMLLGVGFAVALAFGAGRILLAGTEAGSLEPWRHLAISKVRFVVALVLLGGVGTLDGSGGASAAPCEGAEVVAGDEQARAVFSELYDCVLSPAMGTSVGLGMVLLDAVSLQSRVGASETSLLTHASSEAEQFLEMARGVGSGEPPVVMKGVMTLAAGLNQVGRLGMAQGLGYISDSRMVEVAPIRWTPEYCAKEVSQCGESIRPTRRSTGARWLSWCLRVARPGNWLESTSALRRRFAIGCVRPSARSYGGFVGRFASCAKNETYWQKLRPGSLGRPARYRGGLRAREREPGP